MVRKIFIFCVLILVNTSCLVKIYNKKYLFPAEKAAKENLLRFDGIYYYSKYTDNQIFYIYPKVFFKNGYFLDLGYIPSKGSFFLGKNTKTYCPKTVKNENTLESALINAECILNHYGDFYYQAWNLGFINGNYKLQRWGRYKIIGRDIIVRFFYNYHADLYLAETKGRVISSDSLFFYEGSTFKDKQRLRSIINEGYTFKKLDFKIQIPKRIKSL